LYWENAINCPQRVDAGRSSKKKEVGNSSRHSKKGGSSGDFDHFLKKGLTPNQTLICSVVSQLNENTDSETNAGDPSRLRRGGKTMWKRDGEAEKKKEYYRM